MPVFYLVALAVVGELGGRLALVQNDYYNNRFNSGTVVLLQQNDRNRSLLIKIVPCIPSTTINYIHYIFLYIYATTYRQEESLDPNTS